MQAEAAAAKVGAKGLVGRKLLGVSSRGGSFQQLEERDFNLKEGEARSTPAVPRPQARLSSMHLLYSTPPVPHTLMLKCRTPPPPVVVPLFPTLSTHQYPTAPTVPSRSQSGGTAAAPPSPRAPADPLGSADRKGPRRATEFGALPLSRIRCALSRIRCGYVHAAD